MPRPGDRLFSSGGEFRPWPSDSVPQAQGWPRQTVAGALRFALEAAPPGMDLADSSLAPRLLDPLVVPRKEASHEDRILRDCKPLLMAVPRS